MDNTRKAWFFVGPTSSVRSFNRNKHLSITIIIFGKQIIVLQDVKQMKILPSHIELNSGHYKTLIIFLKLCLSNLNTQHSLIMQVTRWLQHQFYGCCHLWSGTFLSTAAPMAGGCDTSLISWSSVASYFTFFHLYESQWSMHFVYLPPFNFKTNLRSSENVSTWGSKGQWGVEG